MISLPECPVVEFNRYILRCGTISSAALNLSGEYQHITEHCIRVSSNWSLLSGAGRPPAAGGGIQFASACDVEDLLGSFFLA